MTLMGSYEGLSMAPARRFTETTLWGNEAAWPTHHIPRHTTFVGLGKAAILPESRPSSRAETPEFPSDYYLD